MGGARSKEEVVVSLRAYSECWFIDEALCLKTFRRGFSLDCSVEVLDAVDEFPVVNIPNPRDLVGGRNVLALEMRPSDTIGVSLRSCLVMGGFSSRRLLLTSRTAGGPLPSVSDAISESLFLGLEKIDELYAGILDVEEAGVACRLCCGLAWCPAFWGASTS